MASSILLSNDVRTVLKATLMGGFGGEISFGLGLVTNPGKFGRTVLGGMITGGIAGGVKGLTSCIAAGDDAKTTAWNTLKGIAGGATIGGIAAAIGYGAAKAGSKGLLYRRNFGTDGRGPEEDRGYQGRRPGLRQGRRGRKAGNEGSLPDL